MISTEKLIEVIENKKYNKMVCINIVGKVHNYFNNLKDRKNNKFSVAYSYKNDSIVIRVFITEFCVKYSMFDISDNSTRSINGYEPKIHGIGCMSTDDFFNLNMTQPFPDVVMEKKYLELKEYFKTSKVRHITCIEDVIDESFELYNKSLYPHYL